MRSKRFFLAETVPTELCDMHEAYWVDTRDGLLTEPAAPNAVKTIFLQFPPLYQIWAHKAGYPRPPTHYSPYSQTARTQQAEPTQEELPIQIVHPNNGDVYAIDPIPTARISDGTVVSRNKSGNWESLLVCR